MRKSRLVVMLDEEAHGALRVEAAMSGQDMAAVVEGLIRKHLPDAMRQFRERRKKDRKDKTLPQDQGDAE